MQRLTEKTADGRMFPAFEGCTLAWSIGFYTSTNEERAGYPRMRAVIQAMLAYRPEQVERERREMLKSSFDRMFGHNAKKVLAVIEDEISKAVPRCFSCGFSGSETVASGFADPLCCEFFETPAGEVVTALQDQETV